MRINLEDMYRCCRWCKWYQGERCINEAFTGYQVDPDGVYKVAEDGRLSGVIEETLHSVDIGKMEADLKEVLRELKVSEKKIKSFFEGFGDCLNEFYDFKCKDSLDEAISVLYQNDAIRRDKEGGGIYIRDPESFYCREFW